MRDTTALRLALGCGALLLALATVLGCGPSRPAAAVASTNSSGAFSSRDGTVTVDDAYILVPSSDQQRVSVLKCTVPPEGNVAGLYFRARNDAGDPDHLVTADTEAADMAMAHLNGVTFEVAPHGAAALEPGGNHVMLMDLTRMLMPGDSVWVTLQFKQAGEVRVRAIVRPIDALSSS